MNNGYVMSDLVEIGSATGNILSSPVKDGPEVDEGYISRPVNDDD